MSAFYDNSVTDVGRLLLADIQSGAKFVPTKIVIGSGYMPQGKSTRTMTEVVEVVKELSLNKVQKTSDGSVIFGTAFSNEDILQPFYYRELGLYAKGVYYNDDGEPSNETKEVLYSYGNSGDNAELIPAYSTGSITERQLDLIVYIGNDTEVVLNIEAGTYVTMPVFTEQIENINKEIITIKADFGDIDDKIGNTTDSEATVSKGTVFGKLNGILSYLTVTLVEKLSKITEDISENKTSIGSAEDLSTSPTIFGKLAEIKETLTTKFSEVISKITEDVSENKEVMGSPEDISSSPTIFGKIADIKETLTSKFSEVVSKITGVDGKIGTSEDSETDTVFGKLNENLKILNNDFFIGGCEIFKGNNTFTVPDNITEIYVTACGRGGNGGARNYNTSKTMKAATGGSGGEAVVSKSFIVSPKQTIPITFGAATVVGDLISLQNGNSGSTSYDTNDPEMLIGAKSNGTGGGHSGNSGEQGYDGVTGQGGRPYGVGGGGGGSLGNGGDAFYGTGNEFRLPGYGGGGGANTKISTSDFAQQGGPAIVIIYWGILGKQQSISDALNRFNNI